MLLLLLLQRAWKRAEQAAAKACHDCPPSALAAAGWTRPALFCWLVGDPSLGPGARLHPGEEHNGIRFYGNVHAPAM